MHAPTDAARDIGIGVKSALDELLPKQCSVRVGVREFQPVD